MLSEKILNGGRKAPLFLQVMVWLRLVFLFVILLIPLYVDSSLYMPYVSGKGFAFRICSAVAFLLTIGIWLYNNSRSLSIHLSGVLIFLYLCASLLVGLAGLDMGRSFWSSYERMDGIVALIHVAIYFMALRDMFRDEKIIPPYFAVAVVVSILVTGVGLAQALGFLPNYSGGSRISSTLGHGFMFSGYLIPALFLSIALIFRKNGHRGVAILSMIAIPHALWGIWVSETRGSQLAVVLGLVLTAIGLVLSLPNRIKVRVVIVLALLVMALASILYLNRDAIPAGGAWERWRGLSLSDWTVHSRISFWKASFEGWKERPILGWGPESFPIVWQSHEDPTMYGSEIWFDRPHNVFMDRLISGGVLLFFVYLAVWAYALRMWAGFPWGSAGEKFGWLGLGVAAFMDMQFSMEHPSVQIAMGMVFAFLSHGEKAIGSLRWPFHSLEGTTAGRRMRTIVWGAIVSVGVVVVLCLNVPGIQLSRALRNMLLSPEFSRENLAQVESDLKTRSFGLHEYRIQLAGKIMQAASQVPHPGDSLEPWWSLGIRELEQERKQVPWDARTAWYLGGLYEGAGIVPKALESYVVAQSLSPRKVMIPMYLSEYCLRNGLLPQAVKYAALAYTLDLSQAESATLCATMVIHTGDTNLGQKIIENHFHESWVKSPKFLEAYASIGGSSRLYEIGSDLTNRFPNEPEGLMALMMASSLDEDPARYSDFKAQLVAVREDGADWSRRIEERMFLIHLKHAKESCRFRRNR